MQIERDRLLTEVENLSASSDGHTQKVQDMHSHKLRSLESQVNSQLMLNLAILTHLVINILISVMVWNKP